MDYPRILLVTEAIPLRNHGGAKQTLYNLLKEYPQDKLGICTIRSEQFKPPVGMKAFYFKDSFFHFLPQALKGRLNYPLAQLNSLLYKLLGYQEIKAIQEWKPDIILVVPMEPTPIWVARQLSRKLSAKVVVYMMDDWLEAEPAGINKRLTSNDLKELLTQSEGWIMISKNMTQTLKDRYHLPKEKVLIAQNPVYPEAINTHPKPVITHGPFRLVYAGAILPMHADGVELVVKAVGILRKQGHEVTISIFTSNYYWSYWEKVWQESGVDMSGVVYGGYLTNPADVQDNLRNADTCIVSASFSPKLAPFTKSSVQTKITDYWASGTPILSVGPDYSACSQFLAEREAGCIVDKNDPTYCAEVILKLIQSPELREKYRNNGLRIVSREHTVPVVTRQINEFFQAIHASGTNLRKMVIKPTAVAANE